MVNLQDDVKIEFQPLGVVLLLTSWNYPIQLSLLPLAGAIAAGNCVLLKPSEIATKTAELLADLIPKYLDNDAIQVICGGKETCEEILTEKFDLIFYVGNSKTARTVLHAAANHLTPVVIESGGKCPVYIAEDADITVAAYRIAWGKFINAGQSCIAPDYVLCAEQVLQSFLEKLRAVLIEFYGVNPQKSADYGRIINERHFDRLKIMLDSTNGMVITGGNMNKEDKYIAPSILAPIKMDDASMQEEIFGPILPVISTKNMEEAIDIVNSLDKPLAIYIFSNTKELMNRFKDETSSGAFMSNDTVMHAGMDNLPFGGIGESGYGAHHGYYSMECFSHRRACVNKSTSEYFNHKLRYPPYCKENEDWIDWALRVAPNKTKCAIL